MTRFNRFVISRGHKQHALAINHEPSVTSISVKYLFTHRTEEISAENSFAHSVSLYFYLGLRGITESAHTCSHFINNAKRKFTQMSRTVGAWLAECFSILLAHGLIAIENAKKKWFGDNIFLLPGQMARARSAKRAQAKNALVRSKSERNKHVQNTSKCDYSQSERVRKCCCGRIFAFYCSFRPRATSAQKVFGSV